MKISRVSTTKLAATKRDALNETGDSDTKSIRFGINQNLRYARTRETNAAVLAAS